jgi:hypothetical protein
MSTKITIIADNITLQAELNDSKTADKISEALPIDGIINTWGDEIYFDIKISSAQEPDARADVEIGELGFWPSGNAFCIFYGRTPASTDDKPRAASAVNIIGKVTDDAASLKGSKNGRPIRLQLSE